VADDGKLRAARRVLDDEPDPARCAGVPAGRSPSTVTVPASGVSSPSRDGSSRRP